MFALVSRMTYRYYLQMSLVVDKWHANSARLASRISRARLSHGEIRLLPLVIARDDDAIHLIRALDPEDNLLKT